jgi:hypothetical protein
MVAFSVVTTETYATATGGFALDISTQLTARKIQWADCLWFVGSYLGYVAYFTKGATAGNLTIRLYATASEIGDGALNGTLQFIMFFTPGAASA